MLLRPLSPSHTRARRTHVLISTPRMTTTTSSRRAVAAALLALVICCGTPRAAVGYMQEINGDGKGGVGGGGGAAGAAVGVGGDGGTTGDGAAGADAAAPVDLEAMASNLPEQLIPGMGTLDVLKLLSGQSVVNDKPGSPWSAKRPKDTGDFNVKHDHDGDGHMCDPAAALQNLQTLKNVEKGGGKKGKKKGGGDGGGEVNPDAQAARIGFEQCLNDIMPGLLRATDFSQQIPCHTQAGPERGKRGLMEGERDGGRGRNFEAVRLHSYLCILVFTLPPAPQSSCLRSRAFRSTHGFSPVAVLSPSFGKK